MRVLPILLSAAAALGACTSTPDPGRAQRDSAKLQQALAGRAAGGPVTCLPAYRSRDMTVLDNGTLLFRDGRTVWVNQLAQGCARAGSLGYAMVTRNFGGTGLCRGDIVQLVDTSSGMFGGSCTVGDFVPYR